MTDTPNQPTDDALKVKFQQRFFQSYQAATRGTVMRQMQDKLIDDLLELIKAHQPQPNSFDDLEITDNVCSVCGSTTCGCRLGGRYKQKEAQPAQPVDGGELLRAILKTPAPGEQTDVLAHINRCGFASVDRCPHLDATIERLLAWHQAEVQRAELAATVSILQSLDHDKRYHDVDLHKLILELIDDYKAQQTRQTGREDVVNE